MRQGREYPYTKKKTDAAVMHMSWPTVQKRNMQIRLLASDSECRVIFTILHAWQPKQNRSRNKIATS